MCGVTGRLPTSLTLIRGLEKLGTIAVASGGLTDIWRGNLDHTQVAIKAFRIYPPQNLREAKMVSKHSVREACSLAEFPDSMAPGRDVEAPVSPEYPAVSRGKHVTLSTVSCL